jgi:hypothetical protein
VSDAEKVAFTIGAIKAILAMKSAKADPEALALLEVLAELEEAS